jgi:hypothetical protein
VKNGASAGPDHVADIAGHTRTAPLGVACPLSPVQTWDRIAAVIAEFGGEAEASATLSQMA